MLHELAKDEYHLVIPLFEKNKDSPVIFGVIEDNNPGKIYVDNKESPTYALLWAHTEEDFFLVGDSSNDQLIKNLNELITISIPEIAGKIRESAFNLFLCSKGWEEKLDLLFAGKGFQNTFIYKYALNTEEFRKHKNWRKNIPKDCELKSVDKELFNKVVDDGGTKFEKWWTSYKLFKEHGLGYSVIVNDDIASTCFACFGGANSVEIGILTEPKYQKRGYAFLTAAAFIEECLERNIKPVWSTGKNNIPSQKLAEKLGFEKKEEKEIYYFVYDEFDNYYDRAYTLTYVHKEYHKAINEYEKAIAIKEPDRFFFYHYACTLALIGEVEKAYHKLHLFLKTLTPEILKHKDFIISNKNLDNLKDDKRWKEFLIKLDK